MPPFVEETTKSSINFRNVTLPLDEIQAVKEAFIDNIIAEKDDLTKPLNLKIDAEGLTTVYLIEEAIIKAIEHEKLKKS